MSENFGKDFGYGYKAAQNFGFVQAVDLRGVTWARFFRPQE